MTNHIFLGVTDDTRLTGYSTGYHPEAPDPFIRKSLAQLLVNLLENYPDNYDWSRFGYKETPAKEEKIELLKMLLQLK